jgi:tetratricopeptide (TPR) repeat protein
LKPARQILYVALLAIGLGGSSGAQAHEEALPQAVQADQTPSRAATGDRDAASDRAIDRWTRSTTANPDDAHAWMNLGNALMQKSREQPRPALFDRAETAFRNALSKATNHAEALVGLAWVHNTRHEFDEGIDYARQAIAADPRVPDAHALLGDAAVELGDYDEALDHYQQALDLAPNLSSYSRAAHLLWLTGDTRKARWLMQRAIAAGGPYAENTAWCRAELALMSFHSGALLAAEQEVDAALRGTPNHPHVLSVAARIKAARKHYETAVDLYRRALAQGAESGTLVALGDVLSLLGKKDEAEAQYQRFIDLQGADAAAHSHGDSPAHVHPPGEGNAQLARFYADHDRNLPTALREAEAAYKTYKNVFVADTLAWCYYKNGRQGDARRTIRQALRWHTPDAGILFHAGMIHAAAGDKPGAQKYLYQALSLNPNFHPVQAGVAAETLRGLGATPASVPVAATAPPASQTDLPQP